MSLGSGIFTRNHFFLFYGTELKGFSAQIAAKYEGRFFKKII